MLLHGFAQWSQMWIDNGVAERLSGQFAVLLPDRRGHGQSGRPTRPLAYGLWMVEDVFDLLDAEGFDAAHLVGYSHGSEIAWRAALERPERVSSVFLMASGWPGPDLDVALDGYREILEWLPQASPADRQWLTPDMDLAALCAIVSSMREVLDVPAEEMVRLRVPAFGLAGEDDPERQTLERLSDMLPDYTFEVLPGTDHLGTWRHPQMPELVERFLTRGR